MVSRAEKQTIKSFGLWRSMMMQDQMRAEYEHRMMECMGLHNAHVHLQMVENYYLCGRAVDRYAEELKLFPQS